MITAIFLAAVAHSAPPREPPPPFMFDPKSVVQWSCDLHNALGQASKISGVTSKFEAIKYKYRDLYDPTFTSTSIIQTDSENLFSGTYKTNFFSGYDEKLVIDIEDGDIYPFNRYFLIMKFRGNSLNYAEPKSEAIIEIGRVHESGRSVTSTIALGFCKVSGLNTVPYRKESQK